MKTIIWVIFAIDAIYTNSVFTHIRSRDIYCPDLGTKILRAIIEALLLGVPAHLLYRLLSWG
jgi:hypothetical protein